MSKEIEVAGRKIGYEHPCFVVAELGLNHGGDLDTALRMVDEAAECGVDAVKVQNYRTGDFVKNKTDSYTYKFNSITMAAADVLMEVTESQWVMFQRHELCFEDLKAIRDRCCERGVVFHSTPSGMSGVKDLIEIGARHILKISSDIAWDREIILEGACFDSTVISTGLYPNPIVVGALNLIFLHCVREYPTPDHKANLDRIFKMKRDHDLVGYSDHTRGIRYAISSAIDYQACWLEMHFTLSHKSYGPDHLWSKDPKELKEIVKSIRSAGR